MSELKAKISVMESDQHVQQMKEKSEIVDRSRDRSRLTKKLKLTVEEFENLSSILCQMLNGVDDNDLDVGRLLGVDLCSSDMSTTPTEVGVDDFYQELFRIERVLRQNTDDLREKVSNRYAENLASNSGCISQ